jgi:hypothetical protein
MPIQQKPGQVDLSKTKNENSQQIDMLYPKNLPNASPALLEEKKVLKLTKQISDGRQNDRVLKLMKKESISF